MADIDRRGEVVRALLRVMARTGLDGVSVRSVAAEAGCSVGMVQRQFATKDAMLRAAMDEVVTAMRGRIGRIMAADLAAPGAARAFLKRVAGELLAVRPDEREVALVWVAFLAHAAVTPDVATELRRYCEPAREAVAGVLEHARRRRRTAAGVRPEPAARTFMALVDGYTAHVLVGLVDAATASAAMAAHVDTLFRPE